MFFMSEGVGKRSLPEDVRSMGRLDATAYDPGSKETPKVTKGGVSLWKPSLSILMR